MMCPTYFLFNSFYEKDQMGGNDMTFNPGEGGGGFGFGNLERSNAKVYKGEQTGIN